MLPVAVWVQSNGAVLETWMPVVAMPRGGLMGGYRELGGEKTTHVRTCHAQTSQAAP